MAMALAGEPASTPAAKTVEAVRARRQDVARKIRLPGSVEPWEQVTLYARASGYLKEIRVERGDVVKAGDVLAVLEIPEMAGELDKARAEAALQTALAERQKAAQAQDAGATSQQDVDVAAAKARATQASLARLEALSAFAEIKAPFAGRIAERRLSPGALVQAGMTAVAVLAQTDRLRVLVDLPDTEAKALRIGAAATVAIAAMQTSVEGRVGRISGRLDSATRTLRLEVDLDNAEGKVMPGHFADVTLVLEVHPQSLVVPAGAVLPEKGRKYVMILAPQGGASVARKREVKTGMDDGIVTEISEGLSGDELLAANPKGVSDAEVVSVKEKP
jgi:RND family efflux transporter MFP subunit